MTMKKLTTLLTQQTNKVMRQKSNLLTSLCFQLCLLIPIGVNAQTIPKKPDFLVLNKGASFVGFTGGTSVRESENEIIFGTNLLEQKKEGFNVVFSGGYFYKKDVSLGIGIGFDKFSRSQISENSDGIITNYKEAGSILTSAIFIKNYIPLSSNGRFNLYNLTGLGYSLERKISESFTENVLTRTYTVTNGLRIGLSPGIQVFILKGFATEVGMTIAGLSTSQTKTTENDVTTTNINKVDLNLKINILNINLSFYYYFPTKHYEK